MSPMMRPHQPPTSAPHASGVLEEARRRLRDEADKLVFDAGRLSDKVVVRGSDEATRDLKAIAKLLDAAAALRVIAASLRESL